jgi:hypothetical protein
MMNNPARIPDLSTRERHVRNAQAACQQLESFTSALDELIAQLETEIQSQSRSKTLLTAKELHQSL